MSAILQSGGIFLVPSDIIVLMIHIPSWWSGQKFEEIWEFILLASSISCQLRGKIQTLHYGIRYETPDGDGSMETPILDLFLYIIPKLELSTHLYHKCRDSHLLVRLLGTPFFSGGLNFGWFLKCKLLRKDPHKYFVLASNELQTRHHFLIGFYFQGFYCPKNSNGLMYCIRLPFYMKPFTYWSTV